MELIVLAVGKGGDAPTDMLFRDYARRCPRPLRLVEVQARGAEQGQRRKDAEAALLLAAIPDGAAVVVLDSRGRDLTSEDFAARLGAWRDEGRRAAAFLIGGPEGLASAVTGRADLQLAFGRMTWPHRLARAMLAEQLYRATAILRGHPYHRP